MSRTKNIDGTELTDDKSIMDLLKHAMQRVISPDKCKGKTRFTAAVISDAQKIDAPMFETPSGKAPKAPRGQFKFRAQILDKPCNPHAIFVNVLDPDFAPDPAVNLEHIMQYPEFYSTESSAYKKPKKGDIVMVDLRFNVHGYNLVSGEYVGPVMTDGYSATGKRGRTSARSAYNAGGGSGAGARGGEAEGGYGTGGTNADKLRSYMKKLTDDKKLIIWEKDTQLSNAGDITQGLAIIAANVFKLIGEKLPGARIKVTAGRDRGHKGHNSRHNSGKAIDFAFNPKPSPDEGKSWSKHRSGAYVSNDDVKAVREILAAVALTDPDFKFIDEYNYPSGYATGPHFHISYERPGWESNKTQAFYEAALSAGALMGTAVDFEILDEYA